MLPERRKVRRRLAVIVALIGATIGIFWLFAIDAGMNGARWPPNWRTWPALLTCPFIPLVGLSRLANVLVPVLNASTYGLLGYAAASRMRES